MIFSTRFKIVISAGGLKEENCEILSPILNNKERKYIFGLLTKCDVKMAGYWPGSFFCVFMDRNGVEVHKYVRKEFGQYPAILTEQAWPINDLLQGFRKSVSCETHGVVPSG